jgi:lipopolysaccharide/colanic/teichoic acid biosynthesis glycosyltransferase
MFDVLVAVSLLLVALPILLLVAVAIKLDSRGPVFYRVRRIGHRGRPFMMLKFRKMHRDARGGPLTTGCDSRFTRIGGVLTRTRLDELPQLWDVLRGRMSVIGPRPEDPLFVELHRTDYDEILTVRPGITGITQLAFAGESAILDEHDPIGDYISRILPQKVGLDRLYARRQTLRLDVTVLLWTVAAVPLRQSIAVHRATGRMNIRRRPVAVSATELAPCATLQSTGAH